MKVDVAQAPSVAHEQIAGVTTVEGKDVRSILPVA